MLGAYGEALGTTQWALRGATDERGQAGEPVRAVARLGPAGPERFERSANKLLQMLADGHQPGADPGARHLRSAHRQCRALAARDDDHHL